MKCIIGLGNPGRKYELTRHNIGFLAVDSLVESGSYRSEYLNHAAGYFLPEKDLLLIKPLTYMNLSGRAVREVVEKKIKYHLEDLIIVCDDLDLPFGKMRFRSRGSAGGHNGLLSIINTLGSNEFARLRLGIGEAGFDTVQYVLGKFSPDEKKDLPHILAEVQEALLFWTEEGIESAMNRYNGRSII